MAHDPRSWWHWLADLWTPGLMPGDTERAQSRLDEMDLRVERLAGRLDSVEDDVQQLKRQMRAETEMMRRVGR